MILFNIKSHGQQLADKAGFTFNPVGDVIISRVNNGGELLGGVIFRDFNKQSIGIHVASFVPNWINRDLLWVVFDYAFNQCGVAAIFGSTPAHNTKALAFNFRIGFKELTRIPEVFPEGDLVVLRMRREECPWLGIKPRYLKRNRLES